MTAQRRQRGLTLVELMVAVAIGLFLVAVMGTIFLGSKGTFVSQDTMARLQENGRFAMDTIGADLRMAGFRGCFSKGRTLDVKNVLNGPTRALYDFGVGISVSRNVGGSTWSPVLDAAISGLSPAPNAAGHVITVRRPIGTGQALIAAMSSNTAALSVSVPSSFQKGDLLLVTDCGGAAVFQASNADVGTTGSIEHVAGTAGLTPDMSTSDLSRTYAHDALVYRMQAITYYLAPSARPGKTGVMALWAFANPSYDGTVQPAELVTGVERMAVSLGIDTDGDQNANQYLAPDAVTDWTTVVSARIDLLLASATNNVTTAPQPYVFAGVSTTPTDRKLRTVMTLVSSLRNTLP